MNSEMKMGASDSFFSKKDSIQSDTLVKMERTVCFGTCPAYELTIQKDGKVTFIGKQFVEQEGMVVGEMSETKMKELMQNIRESHFMEIPSDPECATRYTDMPSVFLRIHLDGNSHGVNHYHGCKGFQFEQELYNLETAIDSLAGTKVWIEGE